jgi:hypothetical protein
MAYPTLLSAIDDIVHPAWPAAPRESTGYGVTADSPYTHSCPGLSLTCMAFLPPSAP